MIDQNQANQAIAARPVDTRYSYGLIAVNEKTQGHNENLTRLGYDVKEVEISIKGAPVKHLAVKGQFLQTSLVIDITTPEKAIAFGRAVVANKRLMGYNQKFKFPGQKPDDKPLYGGPALNKLGSKALTDALGFNFTCLIAKFGKTKRTKTKVDVFA